MKLPCLVTISSRMVCIEASSANEGDEKTSQQLFLMHDLEISRGSSLVFRQPVAMLLLSSQLASPRGWMAGYKGTMASKLT